MPDLPNEDILNALKIAFTYMPRVIEVNKFDYGENYQKVLADIDKVKEILIIHHIDPEEVYGEVNPDDAPNSCY